MKVVKGLLALSLCLGAWQASAEDQWSEISRKSYEYPGGVSRSVPYQFANGLKTDKLVVLYDGQFCKDLSTTKINVSYKSDPLTFETVVPTNGVISLSGEEVMKIVVFTRQPTYEVVTCTERVFIAKAPAPTPSEYIGTIDLGAGATSAEIELPRAKIVKQVMLEIPRYCGDLKVSEFGTLTEGFFQAAELINAETHLYAIDGGNGEIVKGFRLAAENITERTCSVGVYILAE